MTDRITAPFTEHQVAALNASQRSGVMPPLTCEMPHRLRQTLIAEWDGLRCPDEDCDYQQTWAHAFMAQPVAFAGVVVWPRREEVSRSTDPMAAELKRVRKQLRATEDQLAEARRRIAELSSRREAVLIHEAIQRIPEPAPPPCGETLYTKPINDVPTGGKL